MRLQTTACWFVAAALALCAAGCPSGGEQGAAGEGGADAPPSFSLAWSEYPSWSAFGVAGELGIIDGAKGKLGEVEKRWNVDIVLNEADYDACLQQYSSASVDAVCITNIDILSPGAGRPGVGILPTSTSIGGDACIVTGIEDLAGLKGQKVRGLEKSVSEYVFNRGVELAGMKPSDFEFSNMDPGAAAVAMQQGQEGVNAIVVWNPFKMDTLEKRPGEAKVLFDSSQIPEEVIDMVVVARSSLEKPGGDRFAAAVADAFYTLNARLADEKTRDKTLVALGEKFSDLKLEAMKQVVVDTVFYKNADEALDLFKSDRLKEKMKPVEKFVVDMELVSAPPKVAYGKAAEAKDAHLVFDTSYLEAVKAKEGASTGPTEGHPSVRKQ